MQYARLVHPGFWFGKTPLQEAVALAKRGVGGFCLYGGTRREIADFVKTVRAASPLNHLLISADYEDGLGRWVSDAPLLASNLALGAANDETLAFEKGFITARQARSLGVDWVFAPVLDLADNPLNPIVNTRAFSARSADVIRLARAFLNGLKHGGVLNSLKHFPGHGDTTTDSHLALPVLTKTAQQLRERELRPFQALLPLADSVMLGHLLVPDIDEKPASLSPYFLRTLLREEMGFTGCILTDALLMKAIGDEKQAALDALNGGADILLVPQQPQELLDFLQHAELPPHQLLHSQRVQDELAARVARVEAPTQPEAFAPSDFTMRTARKAITRQGDFILHPGSQIAYITVANTTDSSPEPFLHTLRQHGVLVAPYNGQPADTLLVLCFRRYQAFAGKIALEEAETAALQRILSTAKHPIYVLLASPWALNGFPAADSTLYTYSPAPEFQITAAEILLGLRPACGSLPVEL